MYDSSYMELIKNGGDKCQNSRYPYMELLTGRGHKGAFWGARMIHIIIWAVLHIGRIS